MSGGRPAAHPRSGLRLRDRNRAAVVERRGHEVLQETNNAHDALDDRSRLVVVARRRRRGQYCNYRKEKSESER